MHVCCHLFHEPQASENIAQECNIQPYCFLPVNKKFITVWQHEKYSKSIVSLLRLTPWCSIIWLVYVYNFDAVHWLWVRLVVHWKQEYAKLFLLEMRNELLGYSGMLGLCVFIPHYIIIRISLDEQHSIRSHMLLLCKNMVITKLACCTRIVYTKLNDSLRSQCGTNWIYSSINTIYSVWLCLR